MAIRHVILNTRLLPCAQWLQFKLAILPRVRGAQVDDVNCKQFSTSSLPQESREVWPGFWQIRGMDLLSLTRDELAAELERLGHPRYRAAQLCAWMYEIRAKRFEQMTNLPATLRAQLGASSTLRPLARIRETGSMDTRASFFSSCRMPN